MAEKKTRHHHTITPSPHHRNSLAQSNCLVKVTLMMRIGSQETLCFLAQSWIEVCWSHCNGSIHGPECWVGRRNSIVICKVVLGDRRRIASSTTRWWGWNRTRWVRLAFGRVRKRLQLSKGCFRFVCVRSWLTLFYCDLQLSVCRWQWSGCVKVPCCCGCVRNAFVFCSWASQIVLEWPHQGCDGDLSADFSPFWRWWFIFFKKSFSNMLQDLLWRRDPVLEL